MKRTVALIMILVLGGMLVFGFSGCSGKKYRVDYGGQKDCFKGAKDYYPAGKKVTLYYDIIATDTDYSFYVNGERVNPDYSESKGYIISFVMPEQDITIKVESKNSMEYIPEGGEKAVLSFSSFDGGGPEFSVKIEDESVVSCDMVRDYGNQNHAEIDGAAYDWVITFTGLAPGETKVTVSARSPIADNFDSYYTASVDEELNVTLTLIETVEIENY